MVLTPHMRTRVKKTTKTLTDGTKVTTTKLVTAPELEWKLQAEAVRQLRALPEFGVRFDLEGDFNAARRSPQEAVKAQATGLTPGAFDVRIYMEGGQLGLIELKGARGRLSADQKVRHADLLRLGFKRQAVVQAAGPEEAAHLAVSLVLGWLDGRDWPAGGLVAANDNQKVRAVA